ncbi:MAG: hypothetical protein NT067_02685 [Candidatus Diapherotrites archaeon]|nr:hypothetical protein [Candidatus Diapherotrites archaeon]
MKLLVFLAIAFMVSFVFLQGCSLKDYGGAATNTPAAKTEDAVKACKALCNETRDNGIDIENGPCLSTKNQGWNVLGWVCDVAHSPREEVDDQKENQCPEFGVTVSRFVEVSPQCTLVRASE